jgi:hypothetical protein
MRQALNYNADKLHAAFSNMTLKPTDKYALIKKLYSERIAQVNAVMTPDLQKLYLQKQTTLLQQNATVQSALLQQHAAAKVKVKVPQTDTSKTSKK